MCPITYTCKVKQKRNSCWSKEVQLDGIDVEWYKTEEQVLLAWTRFMQKLDTLINSVP